MARTPAFAALFVLSLALSVSALSSCIAFDVQWNLLAFNFGGKDYNAGPKDKWASGSPTDVTASGRPPFDTDQTTCYLSKFGNAIYVLGADKSKTSAIYIYDATAKSWSTQEVNAGNLDPTSFVAILDHDTDVFYALSKGELYSLTMDTLKTAKPDALSWTDVQKPSFDTDGYDPVMALAQNHIHFIGAPGVPAGSAAIFVIHFSYFQPEAQKYGDFPATHGQTASVFQDVGVQKEFVFIPDDGSNTYVINVVTNTTKTFPGPSNKDAKASYFASPDSFVQLSSSGAVSFLPYDNTSTTSAQSSWSTVKNLVSAVPSGASGTSPTGANTAKGSSATGTNGNNGGSGGKGNDAESMRKFTLRMVGAVTLGTIGILLC